MITDKKAANAMGGKTARACDGCLQKRARWYCAADDAFLCQGCDTSVHSANQLASRHERFRFETASSKFNALMYSTTNQDAPASWHQGFIRKARTPRQNKYMLGKQKGGGEVLNLNPIDDPLVPQSVGEEGLVDETEEQLLCRVPEFDSFSRELCNMVISDCDEVAMRKEDGNLVLDGYEGKGTSQLDDGLHGFLPSDLDLEKFAADVESLLGVGLDEDACDSKGIELLDCKEEDESNAFHERKMMKVKDEEEDEGIRDRCFDSGFAVTGASLNWSFDYDSPTIGEEEEKKVAPVAETTMTKAESEGEMKRNKLLRLNYESVIAAWTSQSSPWTTGSRPEPNPDDFTGSNPKEDHQLNEGIGGIYRQARGNNADGEREARVSRYREKRRTRLFSKKIRYEVRKLNADKRPRMKGRFVKRTSLEGLGTAFPYIN